MPSLLCTLTLPHGKKEGFSLLRTAPLSMGQKPWVCGEWSGSLSRWQSCMAKTTRRACPLSLGEMGEQAEKQRKQH